MNTKQRIPAEVGRRTAGILLQQKGTTYEDNTDYHGSRDWFTVRNRNQTAGKDVGQPVSYTHLTLPTIRLV